ncbi:hypothetical protein [Antribacter gilvus]|uniref:hypothetical protein n=1 Tax=Antribacter gilvus TaxID=2304675 RepID=UPI000F77ECDB|nr:hypothetical protein [Antribacter gilvus]
MTTELPEGVSLDELYVVPGSKMLHSDDCQHQTEQKIATMRPATSAEVDQLELCKSCRRVLSGSRRRYFTSFEDALEAFQAPLENRPRMRDIAGRPDRSVIWIPPSSSYIAVAPAQGAASTAEFYKSYVAHRVDGVLTREELPVAYEVSDGGTRKPAERERGVCTSCYLELLPSGRCGECD